MSTTDTKPTVITSTDLDTKRDHLEAVRKQLKSEFFGVDTQIDQVVDAVKTWYLMPELLTRPQAVVLLGLTGVSKTAVVRSLVSHLRFRDRFLEIQMDGISSGNSSTVLQAIEDSPLQEGQPGIILLDEFQRYRTIDKHGDDVEVKRFQDVWMLLSDGMFPPNFEALERLEALLASEEYLEDQEKERNANEETDDDGTPRRSKPGAKASKVKYKRRFQLYHGEAKTLKQTLRLPESLNEIMTWDKAAVRAMIRAHIEKRANKSLDYTKCLVFIAGNLDEAFQMARDVDDCDTNADIYHEHTKKLGPIEVKAALLRRFKPEQIARLGNNLIVYPSLPSYAYRAIIERSCRQYVEDAYRAFGVSFNIHTDVYREIYENSVYPTQGTRPVFSSINKMFGSPLADGMLWARERGLKEVMIGIDVASSSIVFSAPGQEGLKVRIDFDVRKRKAENSADFNAIVAVHESGHAIIHAALFGEAPAEVAINIASWKGGYNRLDDDIVLSKTDLLNRIAMGMGGLMAEELLFGSELRITGCSSDISNATSLAAKYVRRYGMDGFSSYVLSTDMGQDFNTDLEGTNGAIDILLSKAKDAANALLNKHRDLLIALSRKLLSVNKMDGAAFAAFTKSSFPNLRISSKRDVTAPYARLLVDL